MVPLILDLRSRWRSLSESRPSRFAREKGPWYPLRGGLVGYRAGMDVSEGRKVSCPYWDLSRIPVAARSAAVAAIAGSNPAGGHGCLSFVSVSCLSGSG
jgi:hypothetical protein